MVGSVRAGNVQRVDAEVRTNVRIFGVETQPRVSYIHIEQHGSSELIAASHRHTLRPAERITVLAAAGCVPSCVSQSRRVKNKRRRKAITRKNHPLLARDIIDLWVDSCQIVFGWP